MNVLNVLRCKMLMKIWLPWFQIIMVIFWTGNIYADGIDPHINPKPIFKKKLENITLEVGNAGRFICETDSDYDNIEWYRTKVSENNTESDEVSEAKIDESYGSNMHELTNVKHEDEGWYSCVARKKNLEINFSTAYLKIVDKLPNDDKKITQTEGHRPYFINKMDLHPFKQKSRGESLDLKCDAAGNPEPNITWYKNGIHFTRRSFQATIEWNKNSVVLPGFTEDDVGNYTCMLCNQFGCINHTFSVQYDGEVYVPPTVTKKLENLTLEVGTTGSFTCETINSNDHIEWYQNKASKENVDSEEFLESLINGSEGRNTYELKNVKYENEGWYSCVVRNMHDEKPGFSTAYLKVVDELPSPEKNNTETMLDSPYFTNKSELHQFIYKARGESLNLSCAASGNPKPSISWYINGRLLTNISSRATFLQDGKSIILRNFTQDDTGDYVCYLWNNVSSVLHTFRVQLNDLPKVKDESNTVTIVIVISIVVLSAAIIGIFICNRSHIGPKRPKKYDLSKKINVSESFT